MLWIAPSEKDLANDALEKRLWNADDQFRANSGLTAAQYSAPVLGLIFLLFAETRFAQRRAQLESVSASSRRATSRTEDPAAYHAENVIYLPQAARFDHLLSLPEGANVGQAINDAMTDIEKHNPQLAGVLPRTYQIWFYMKCSGQYEKFVRNNATKLAQLFTAQSPCAPPKITNKWRCSWARTV